ncbi:L,D-transpeptidase family protein [Sphaerisporangium sp. TRM90804]|uniref:L,D-transpeptidase family protein n=1 Tax=Sphaerisporangium sp. TRM90804 TaxID=3031113 RepID=UPI00244697D1|nr:L,D-transpeptidase family protein [Sphaerisporangium sp. TRM90804]MDH2428686.1 L,D-transpeptidase family protein [Sphaerisporangium sp. TRM90804]
MEARKPLAAAAALAAAGALVVSGCGVASTRPATAGVAPAGAHGASPVVALGVSVSGAARAAAEPVAPVAPFVAPRKRVKLGAKGSAVKALQGRLKALGYVPGRVDSRYGGTTQAAVWAFQKVQGISPTSTITSRTWKALENPKVPKIMVPKGKPDRMEVDLTKQVAVLYRAGAVRLITHISSGSGIPYCETTVWQGREQRFCGDARTPTGNFKTTWRRTGWHTSYLGSLYNPIFFNGGIAFHGALSVPLYPASHGCVRLPMNVAQVLPGMLGTGVPVHVKGKFRR